MNNLKNPANKIFPIINFFEAKACKEINLDDGKIEIFSNENIQNFKNKKIEISFVLPEEYVEVKSLTYRKEKYFYLHALKGNQNINRQKPKCIYFETCGGCLYQHMKPEFYVNHKMKMLEKTFLDAELNIENSKIKDIKVIGPNLRRKANFEGIKKNGEIFLGFHRFGSRQIINLNSCEILHPEISNLLPDLKNLLGEVLDEFQKCEIFIVLAENGIEIGFKIHSLKILDDLKIKKIQIFCEKYPNIIRFSFNPGKNIDIIYKDENSKNPYLIFGNFEVNINAYSFMQTSHHAEQEMICAIRSFFPENHKDLSLVDLFCGRGLYALNFAIDFKSIYGFEIEESALSAFGAAIKQSDLKEKFKLLKHDLFLEPILSNFFNESQFVIINPPRAGAEEVCKQIIQSGSPPKNLVYVSCNPKTFVRDAKILLEANYEIKKIIPIDQFIWSNHLELIVHFERI